ncbi:DNA translocase FtsK [Coxiella endosymbiont of Amblyomma sculptum]|nr:DNA translocase FtsK [Coxiella endosymbiont of Amblyomma sculptum]
MLTLIRIRKFSLQHKGKNERTKMRKQFNNRARNRTERNLRYRICEGFLILTLAFSIFLFLSLLSHHASDFSFLHDITNRRIKNITGKIGARLSNFFLHTTGYLAYLFPPVISFFGWILFKNRHLGRFSSFIIWSLYFSGFLLVLLSSSALAFVYFPYLSPRLSFDSGGVLGTILAKTLLSVCNKTGTSLILISSFMTGITFFTGLSWFRSLETLCKSLMVMLTRMKSQIIPYRSFLPKKLFGNRRDKKETIISESQQHKGGSSYNRSSKTIVHHRFALAEYKTSYFKNSLIIPDPSLLDKPDGTHNTFCSTEELQKKSTELELCLSDFGVQSRVVVTQSGPVITRFELALSTGTKVSRIVNLEKDLARSLSVANVRIVEIIPGKSVIGIEIPNKIRKKVTLYEVLSTDQYRNAQSSLTLALGQDITGRPVIVDLGNMPHLLVAGTTGSGKSINLNVMLLSLLYKSTPEQIKLILIDPKMIEFSVYEGIPHLLSAVVTDVKEAASALQWCISEMERRYHLMALFGVRNVSSYNAKIQKKVDETKTFSHSFRRSNNPIEFQGLPQIVVMADEFSDIMVATDKKIEALVVRLAQKSRAAGIHLVFATQRPSVDIITGSIKANIPARIAFQVSSKIDSRTILDRQGAEQLLGCGDFLYLASGSGIPMRIHGSYVGDEEVRRTVEYWKKLK